ncbi:Beta-ketoadipyl-CoA thiolase [Pseudomonas reidholzensis]|uniref:Beta-ketoadipyl-CoA thiolase n=1 Tax=Pseudomonas reidholzensis TaxID=1785162 RepID=A0A383RUP7_9PSED|nr:thiolase family protein [Pseudomonas reidholzensis]SYX90226.1 Beta-ketoadipyl-CoA thiolase [Pseudomonas reidholzensis]
MSGRGQYRAFAATALLDGVRTPWVDLNGPLALLSPTDLGIKAGRAVLQRAGVEGREVDSVLAGSMAQADFDAYMLPRHIGLYCGVDQAVPALMVQRICATGFELLRQAGEQIEAGEAGTVLCVAAESMSRNPIVAYTHRGGFRLGSEVGFKDFLWEALFDPAVGISMIETAENIARQYHISRPAVDAWAAQSFARTLTARAQGWFSDECVSVVSEVFEAPGLRPRGIRLPRGVDAVSEDSHPRPTSLERLAQLSPVYPDGVQTAGNSCAVVDGAAAVLMCSAEQLAGRRPLAWLRASSVVGVAPEVMGLGPVPAIRLLLERTGLALADIAHFEINEAQGAQILAVQQALGIDPDRLNARGGAIALGHPLAATGVRLALSVARQLRASGQRYGVASACVGGGQGMALLLENPHPVA